MYDRSAPGRVPTEFRYWDRVQGRGVELVRRAWKLVWGFDSQPPEALETGGRDAEFQAPEHLTR